MTEWMQCGAAILATWRVTHLLANEDGPAAVIARVRERLGTSAWGALLDCFQCMSVWVAAPFALYLVQKPVDRIVTWLALSGAACLIETVLSKLETGDSHELLWKQTQSPQGVAFGAPRADEIPGHWLGEDNRTRHRDAV
jgi:hypothetical protein